MTKRPKRPRPKGLSSHGDRSAERCALGSCAATTSGTRYSARKAWRSPMWRTGSDRARLRVTAPERAILCGRRPGLSDGDQAGLSEVGVGWIDGWCDLAWRRGSRSFEFCYEALTFFIVEDTGEWAKCERTDTSVSRSSGTGLRAIASITRSRCRSPVRRTVLDHDPGPVPEVLYAPGAGTGDLAPPTMSRHSRHSF